jgi:uncharacterized protein (DUF1684 family)
MNRDRLSQFREHKDHFFAHGEHSPLPADQREEFNGLAYFDENPALSFTVALTPAGAADGDRLDLATTDGATQPFLRAGRAVLPIGDETIELTVLRDLERGRYFLPFRDATSGSETYELGRYLDPRERPDGTLVVNFNYAYNPYCAYAEGWSCPIPPEENIVSVRIEAGEKSFAPVGDPRVKAGSDGNARES